MKTKSRLVSFILTVLLGPLGLFYSSAAGAVILIVLAVVTLPTVVGPFVCWGLAVLWGDTAAHRHNKAVGRLLDAIRQR